MKYDILSNSKKRERDIGLVEVELLTCQFIFPSNKVPAGGKIYVGSSDLISRCQVWLRNCKKKKNCIFRFLEMLG